MSAPADSHIVLSINGESRVMDVEPRVSPLDTQACGPLSR